jgi:hypothetical protein
MELFLSTFVGAAAFGVLFEIVVACGKHHWLSNFGWKSVLSMTIFNIYGWGFIILAFALTLYPSLCLTSKSTALQWATFIIFAFVTTALFECAGGQMSRLWNGGKQTWKYDKNWIPCCSGYVSVVSTFIFTLFAIVYNRCIFSNRLN